MGKKCLFWGIFVIIAVLVCGKRTSMHFDDNAKSIASCYLSVSWTIFDENRGSRKQVLINI